MHFDQIRRDKWKYNALKWKRTAYSVECGVLLVKFYQYDLKNKSMCVKLISFWKSLEIKFDEPFFVFDELQIR